MLIIVRQKLKPGITSFTYIQRTPNVYHPKRIAIRKSFEIIDKVRLTSLWKKLFCLCYEFYRRIYGVNYRHFIFFLLWVKSHLFFHMSLVEIFHFIFVFDLQKVTWVRRKWQVSQREVLKMEPFKNQTVADTS